MNSLSHLNYSSTQIPLFMADHYNVGQVLQACFGLLQAQHAACRAVCVKFFEPHGELIGSPTHRFNLANDCLTCSKPLILISSTTVQLKHVAGSEHSLECVQQCHDTAAYTLKI